MFFLAGALLAVVCAQGPGKGISKDTRACSEGVIDSTFDFMQKYFPVTEAQDDCSNHVCTCGKQARFSLDLIGESANNFTSPGGQSGFGLHCVYAAGTGGVRAKQSGSKTQEELEAIFSSKFGDMTSYDVFMEYNTGLFTDNISAFVTKLKSGGAPFLTLRWSDSTGSYISVLVHPPKTQIIHEVVGTAASASSDLLASALSVSPRFYFDESPSASSGTMTALWISRATTDVARDEKYFKTVFGGISGGSRKITNGTDGSQMLLVQLSTQATVKIRLVQPASADASSDDYPVSWWETYLSDTHKKYMTSYHCGWDLMADNHNAYDWQGFEIDQGTIVEGVKKAGYSYFSKSVPMGGGMTHSYINTPYGYQMQLDGTYSDPPSDLHQYTGSLCATYMEYC